MSEETPPPTRMAAGHGVKQRDVIRMSAVEVDAYLQGRHSMTMCTISVDGAIHAVAMWYGFLDGAVAFETKTKSQKVCNLRRDPCITCLVETGETYDQLQGVSLVGRGEIIDDPARMFDLGVSLFGRYTGPYTEALRPAVEKMLHKRVVVKVHVDRVITWDHRKLGLAPPRRTASEPGAG